ncbi:ribonuclease E inhibitor RraB [Novipirellula caenicola]|uniref:Regulator of ribonuclease activity B domain-containing protein n=1 Tax=Novipirellula caenicola TaxID=1536901 RepID=A0ABP9VNL9_9BACT
MTTYPEDADGAVLANLQSLGVDMSAPLLIEFAVDAPDEASAHRIEKALMAKQYETEVYYDSGEPEEGEEAAEDDDEEFGPAWTVYVNVTMVPEYDKIMQIQAELDELSKPHGGRSDGWGVMVDEEPLPDEM